METGVVTNRGKNMANTYEENKMVGDRRSYEF